MTFHGFSSKEALREASIPIVDVGSYTWNIARSPDGYWAVWDDAGNGEQCSTLTDALWWFREGLDLLTHDPKGLAGVEVDWNALQRLIDARRNEDPADADRAQSVFERMTEFFDGAWGEEPASPPPPPPVKTPGIETVAYRLLARAKAEHPLIRVWIYRLLRPSKVPYTAGIPHPDDVTVEEWRVTSFPGHESWDDEGIRREVRFWGPLIDLDAEWPGLRWPVDLPEWRRQLDLAVYRLAAAYEDWRRTHDEDALAEAVDAYFAEVEHTLYLRILGKSPGYRPGD